MNLSLLQTLILFNLAMAVLDATVAFHLRRHRTAWAWWRAGICGAGGSLFLVLLFGVVPAFSPRLGVTRGFNPFFVVRLVGDVLFIHAPICMVAATLLLRKTARKTALLSALGALSLLGVGLDAYWIEPTALQVTRLRIESPKLTRPMRIVVLADLQTDSVGAYERRVFERIRDEQADLILLAGDYMQASLKREETLSKELNAMMREVGIEAPDGVFAVQGNADRPSSMRRLFEGLPITLAMSTSTFDVGPIRLTCLSMGHSFDRNFDPNFPESDRFHLVMGHSPDFALGQVDADLLVAGHTHGGQVQLPWVGPLSTGCRVPRAWAAGLTELPGGGKLFVSRGVGMERGLAPRLRFLCRPELVVIDLVPEGT